MTAMRRMRQWWRRRLRKINIDEVVQIAGSDWSTVWRKLGVSPHTTGCTILGELEIRGKRVLPIVAHCGFSSRLDVVDALVHQLRLEPEEAMEFLSCNYDGEFVIARTEERFVTYDDTDDDVSGS
jgi:hypothetical protein